MSVFLLISLLFLVNFVSSRMDFFSLFSGKHGVTALDSGLESRFLVPSLAVQA